MATVVTFYPAVAMGHRDKVGSVTIRAHNVTLETNDAFYHQGCRILWRSEHHHLTSFKLKMSDRKSVEQYPVGRSFRLTITLRTMVVYDRERVEFEVRGKPYIGKCVKYQ